MRLFDRATELTPHEQFRVVAAQDLTRWTEWEQSNGTLEWVLGIKVCTGTADQGPVSFSLSSLREVEARAAEVVTKDLCQAVTEVLAPESSVALLAAPLGVYLAPFGPLASATLVYGQKKTATAACPDGWQRVQGTTMRQKPHRHAACGVVVAKADEWDVAECDFSEAAHASRANIVTGTKASYHIVARYD